MPVNSLDKLDHVFAKWEKRGPPKQLLNKDSNLQIGKEQNNSHPSNSIIVEGKKRWKDKYGDNIRPAAHRKTRQKRRVISALPEETVTSSVIAQFKTTPSITAESLITTRPFMGQCCNCLPNSQKDFIISSTTTEGIKDICNVKDVMRGNSFIERHFEMVVYALRKKMFKHYADVSLATLTSARVLEAVQQQKQLLEAESDNVSLIQKVEKKPEKILDAMKASISNSLVKFTGWFLLKCLPLFLHSVQVHKGEIEMVKKAHERGLPLIYLPLHRSHLDYILITFILCMQDMKAPYVAAGDNLNIPLFRSLMRGLGGFSIRRKLDRQKGQKDFIYRAVLHTYMQELLKCGDSLEFFIEGGRSRSGKTYTPKAGLLSIVVETLMEGLVEDVYIVPISINYEKILDGNFNSEQMGIPKVKETFWGTLKGIWKVFRSNYGSVRVDFAQPFSLKEYMQVNQPITSSPTNSDNTSDQETSSDDMPQPSDVLPLRSSGSISSLYGTDVVVEDQRHLIKKLAEHVSYTSVHCTALMCTNVLAFLLLNKYREGVNMKQLISEYSWLLEEIKYRKRDIGFRGNTEEVVHYACALLGPNLVSRKPLDNGEDIMVVPVITLPGIFEISYYGNAVSSVFLLESVVVCSAIYNCDINLSRLTDGPLLHTCPSSRENILETAKQLCHLLKYEFIFAPPCASLEELLADALDQMVTCEILKVEDQQQEGNYLAFGNRDPRWAKRLSASLSWADEEDEYEYGDADEQLVQFNVERKDCMEKMLFLFRVLAPYIEAYLVTGTQISKTLVSELPGYAIKTEDEFLLSIHDCAKKRVMDGIASYGESAALDTIKNSVKAYQDLKVIDIYYAGNLRMVELHDHFEVKDKINYLLNLLEILRE